MAQPPQKGSSSTNTEPESDATLSQSSEMNSDFVDVGHDEPPPLYSEVVNENRLAANAAPPLHRIQPPNASHRRVPGVTNYRYPLNDEPRKCRNITLPDRGNTPVDEQVRNFTDQVNNCAKYPPRVFVRLIGTHLKKYRDEHRGNREREEVDFDLQLELTPYLFSDAEAGTSWSTLQTPENHENAMRGSSNVRQIRSASNSTGNGKPSLDDWCRWFCEDTKKLKDFCVARRVYGLDYERIRSKLETIVRRTSYRGKLEVSFFEKERSVVFYNDRALNELRRNECCQVLSVLTCLCIFWIPYMLSVSSSYEVVTVNWFFSRTTEGRREYISMSEDGWCNTWDRAITSGVLGMRQGTLDEEDLRRSQGGGATFRAAGNPAAGELFNLLREDNSIYQVPARGWGGNC
ncbi:hypothetical protein SEPCBS57363_005627 [Sporothrix epigloea]|uniref:Uncharacterized protein n=1 Tax=Sporothrix epigloea TaxID=1892477 RepID=A0ABP0E1L4_9PEZI